MKPNYASYTLEELLDTLEHIDADKFPERHKEILAEIKKRDKIGLNSCDDHEGLFDPLVDMFKQNDVRLYIIGLVGFLIMSII